MAFAWWRQHCRSRVGWLVSLQGQPIHSTYKNDLSSPFKIWGPFSHKGSSSTPVRLATSPFKSRHRFFSASSQTNLSCSTPPNQTQPCDEFDHLTTPADVLSYLKQLVKQPASSHATNWSEYRSRIDAALFRVADLLAARPTAEIRKPVTQLLEFLERQHLRCHVPHDAFFHHAMECLIEDLQHIEASSDAMIEEAVNHVSTLARRFHTLLNVWDGTPEELPLFVQLQLAVTRHKRLWAKMLTKHHMGSMQLRDIISAAYLTASSMIFCPEFVSALVTLYHKQGSDLTTPDGFMILTMVHCMRHPSAATSQWWLRRDTMALLRSIEDEFQKNSCGATEANLLENNSLSNKPWENPATDQRSAQSRDWYNQEFFDHVASNHERSALHSAKKDSHSASARGSSSDCDMITVTQDWTTDHPALALLKTVFHAELHFLATSVCKDLLTTSQTRSLSPVDVLRVLEYLTSLDHHFPTTTLQDILQRTVGPVITTLSPDDVLRLVQFVCKLGLDEVERFAVSSEKAFRIDQLIQLAFGFLHRGFTETRLLSLVRLAHSTVDTSIFVVATLLFLPCPFELSFQIADRYEELKPAALLQQRFSEWNINVARLVIVLTFFSVAGFLMDNLASILGVSLEDYYGEEAATSTPLPLNKKTRREHTTTSPILTPLPCAMSWTRWHAHVAATSCTRPQESSDCEKSSHALRAWSHAVLSNDDAGQRLSSCALGTSSDAWLAEKVCRHATACDIPWKIPYLVLQLHGFILSGSWKNSERPVPETLLVVPRLEGDDTCWADYHFVEQHLAVCGDPTGNLLMMPHPSVLKMLGAATAFSKRCCPLRCQSGQPTQLTLTNVTCLPMSLTDAPLPMLVVVPDVITDWACCSSVE